MQRSTRTISSVLGVTAAALFTAGFAGSAAATEFGPEPAKIEVSYSDLDLAHVEGARALYARLERAAYHVCHFTTVPNTSALRLEQKCIAQALGGAVESVDNANLTAVHLARAGKRSMVASSR